MIVAADDVRHPHVVIIDDHGQHIGRRAIGAQQHHVVKLGIGDGDRPLNFVGDRHAAGLRRLQPDDMRRIVRPIGAIPPAAIIAQRLLGGTLGGAHRLQILGRGIAAIGVAGGEQLVRDRGVAGSAGELIDNFAIPFEIKPREAIENCRDGGFG